MEVKITILSEQLSKEELKALLQAVRDCEQKAFPNKEIFIWVDAPEMEVAEMKQILGSIAPQFKFGPFVIPRREG